MSLDNTKLLDFLDMVDKELNHKIVVVAVGGTAMTLLNAKHSTIDVGFTIPEKFYKEFKEAERIIQSGFRVGIFRDGDVFITALPDDYLKKSKIVRTKLKNIQLRALDPVDIIITKITKLNDRDEQDIESCIKKFKIRKAQIIKRAKEMNYSGNDKVFKSNLETVLKQFF